MLGPGQREALEALAAPLRARGFHLGGGTAIALRLGHRRSLDLDWLVPRAIGDPLRLAKDLRGAGVDLHVGSTSPGALHGAIGGTRVSLIEHRFPLLDPPEEFGGAPVASIKDLGATLLATLADRSARRDYVDVYAIGLRARALAEMLADYRQRHGAKSAARVLAALADPAAGRERMPEMLWGVDWTEIRATLRRWAREAPR